MYKSIEEYVEINYGDDLKKGLICFLAGDDFIDVRDFSVYKINYKTSERDHVVCEVIVRIKYSFVESASRSKVAYYSATMEGSFRKGFKPVSKEFEKLENGKEERYTSSLVPVMAKEEYDAYATKFLKYFCPSALKKPTKLKLDKMLKNKEMVFHPAPLGSEILGKIYFAKDKATIYANLQDLSEVKIVDVGPGTILINYDKITEYGDGAMRNTVIHEAVHYFFHSNYF